MSTLEKIVRPFVGQDTRPVRVAPSAPQQWPVVIIMAGRGGSSIVHQMQMSAAASYYMDTGEGESEAG